MGDFLRWRIGEVTVTRVVELTSATIGNHILPQASPDLVQSLQWLAPFTDDNRLLMSFHSLVIQRGDEIIVVDTCIGNDKERNYPRWNRMQGDFLTDFGAAGFTVDAVDAVLCTHMHVDHVGWSTRLVEDRWQPTFAAARYLYAEEELAHWREHDQTELYGPVIDDSVQPVFDAGLADLVATDHQVSPEVRLEPTPGHTPGHASVHITSQGEEAVITGDVMHHPCQVAHPDWSSTADVDAALGARTRKAFLDRYADRPVLIIGTHFAGPTAGRVVRDGNAFRLDC